MSNPESLRELGDRLQQELQILLSRQTTHWLVDAGLSDADFPQLYYLASAIDVVFQIDGEFAALEQWLTSGFIPTELIAPGNELESDRITPQPARASSNPRNNLPFTVPPSQNTSLGDDYSQLLDKYPIPENTEQFQQSSLDLLHKSSFVSPIRRSRSRRVDAAKSLWGRSPSTKLFETETQRKSAEIRTFARGVLSDGLTERTEEQATPERAIQPSQNFQPGSISDQINQTDGVFGNGEEPPMSEVRRPKFADVESIPRYQGLGNSYLQGEANYTQPQPQDQGYLSPTREWSLPPTFDETNHQISPSVQTVQTSLPEIAKRSQPTPHLPVQGLRELAQFLEINPANTQSDDIVNQPEPSRQTGQTSSSIEQAIADSSHNQFQVMRSDSPPQPENTGTLTANSEYSSSVNTSFGVAQTKNEIDLSQSQTLDFLPAPATPPELNHPVIVQPAFLSQSHNGSASTTAYLENQILSSPNPSNFDQSSNINQSNSVDAAKLVAKYRHQSATLILASEENEKLYPQTEKVFGHEEQLPMPREQFPNSAGDRSLPMKTENFSPTFNERENNPERDIEEVMDAIAHEIAREYRQFYGD